MPKTDKELAIEFASAYVTAWFPRAATVKPLDGDTLKGSIGESYAAIHALPEEM